MQARETKEGGIVGGADNGGGFVEYSYSKGSVTTGGSSVGGIA